MRLYVPYTFKKFGSMSEIVSKLSKSEIRYIRRIRKTYAVSTEFLYLNSNNIRKFLTYITGLHCVIRKCAVRKRNNRVILLPVARPFIIEPPRLKMIRERKRNLKKWSKQLQKYYNRIGRVTVYEEIYPVRETEEILVENKSLEKTSDPDGANILDIKMEEQSNNHLKNKTIQNSVAESDINQLENSSENLQSNIINSTEEPDDQVADVDLQPKEHLGSNEVSKRLKVYLELLNSGKRASLMDKNCPKEIGSNQCAMPTNEKLEINCNKTPRIELVNNTVCKDNSKTDSLLDKTDQYFRSSVELTNGIQIDCEVGDSNNTLDEAEKEVTEPSNAAIGDHSVLTTAAEDTKCTVANETVNNSTAETNVLSKSGNFLDMLMSKVRVKNFAKEMNFSKNPNQLIAKPLQYVGDDSNDDFLGFDESEHQPGMLLTPIVPKSSKSAAGNAAFVSESLNEYMRKNHLCESSEEPTCSEVNKETKSVQSLEGLVTPDSIPPHMDMPAVPENLQKMRTVAERRQYLQRFSKNQKIAIINNEAYIYRELQRKSRNLKVKSTSINTLQLPTTPMPFTRAGWQAASYIATDYNKYYYQTIDIDGETYKLPGTLGNNEVRSKGNYKSKVYGPSKGCTPNCVDAQIWRDFRIIKTQNKKTKLNKFPLSSDFRPCPLSEKANQRPVDDDTSALLLSGGSMVVVSMPIVQLEVFPEIGKPLHEVAKRYLQHVLPHHNITHEWAKFSVSTLQPPRSMREAEAAAAITLPPNHQKSFTFAIPYTNDRNQILVRRVVDRSEPLDDYFVKSKLHAEEISNWNDLKFCADVDKNDSIAVTCADILFNIINSVAISRSENSFVSTDPDDLHPERQVFVEKIKIEKSKDTGYSSKPYAKSLNKQHRLRLELRRLNATIIEKPLKTNKDNEPCTKEECRLGCICESISRDYPIREHCGQASCVLGCKCKSPNTSLIARLDIGGSGISNEDAFMLRRKATARLAPIEKEFTSTVVLTENETLLINESQRDKKRRCTKAPKRYEDFADADEEHMRQTPKKQHIANSVKGSVVSIDNHEHASSNSTYSKITELREPCSVLDTDFMKLKHCTVRLRRLPDMSNVAVFCMVHQLYKCFCNNEAIDGKPVVLDKEEVNTTICHNVNCTDVLTKARYSFDKVEKPCNSIVGKKRRRTVPQIESPRIAAAVNTSVSNIQMQDVCRRVLPVPTQSFLENNRARAASVLFNISKEENEEKQQKLRTLIGSSIKYQKRLNEQLKKFPANFPSTIIDLDEDSNGSNTKNVQVKLTAGNALQSIKKQPVKRVKDGTEYQSDILKLQKFDENLKSKTTLKRSVLKRSSNILPSDKIKRPKESSQTSDNIIIPRIAACYSLNDASEQNVTAAAAESQEVLQLNPIAEVADISKCEDLSAKGKQFNDFYLEVVKNMNSLVSKKMQDIDVALRRNSKLMPQPNEDILCIIKWTNFLAAYESGYVYIWEVKMRNFDYLVATLTNMMPVIYGAIGVMNIVGMDINLLPLLAQMLIYKIRTEFTERLAIIMQGRKHFWHVKGFLLHKIDNFCTKPTPETHPLLTKKINLLCSLLVKQRVKERQNLEKNEEVNKSASTGNSVAPLSPPPLVLTTRATQPVTRNTPTEPIVTMKPNSAETSKKSELPYKIKSNLEFRKMLQKDKEEIKVPEPCNENHRWLVLDLYNDFSHIFVPAFKDMISLDRIHNVMTVAKEKKKTVKLQFFQNAPYDAFVTHESSRKIYFGPLKLNTPPPILVLLQSVDCKMMLREVYQKIHNIPVNVGERTTAFWVLYIDGKLRMDVENECDTTLSNGSKIFANISKIPKAPGHNKNAINNNTTENKYPESEDDDCFIIDDNDEQVLLPRVNYPLKNNTVTSSSNSSESSATKNLNFTIEASSDKAIKITRWNSLTSSTIKDSTISQDYDFPILNTVSTCGDNSDNSGACDSDNNGNNGDGGIIRGNPVPLIQLPVSSTTITSNGGFVPLITNLPVNQIITSIPTSTYLISNKPPLVNYNRENGSVEGLESQPKLATSTIQPKVSTPTLLQNSTIKTRMKILPKEGVECSQVKQPPNKMRRYTIASLKERPNQKQAKSIESDVSITIMPKTNNSNIVMCDQLKSTSINVLKGQQTFKSPVGSADPQNASETNIWSANEANGSIGTTATVNKTTNFQTPQFYQNQSLPKTVKVLPKPLPNKNPAEKELVKKLSPTCTVSLPTVRPGPAVTVNTIKTDKINFIPENILNRAVFSTGTGSLKPVKIITRSNQLMKKGEGVDQVHLANNMPCSLITSKNNNSKSVYESDVQSQGKLNSEKNNSAFITKFGNISAPNLPKLLAKNIGDQYMVRIPDDGVKCIQSMEKVNLYLNQVYKKDPAYKTKVPAKWTFTSSNYVNSLERAPQNLKTNTGNTIEKRKVNNKNVTHATHEPAQITSESTVYEFDPILIDD